MQNLFVQTIRTIAAGLLRGIATEPSNTDLERCAGFAVRELDVLGAVPKKGIRLLLLYLNFVAVFTSGALFYRVSPEKAALLLARWKASAISPKVSFYNFFFTLVVLAYYDGAEVQKNLGIDRVAYLQMVALYNSIAND